MGRILLSFIALVAIISSTSNLKADDHMEVSNLQIQLCKLNDGVTMKEYDAMISEYFEWAKENDVETYFARQTALYPHKLNPQVFFLCHRPGLLFLLQISTC